MIFQQKFALSLGVLSVLACSCSACPSPKDTPFSDLKAYVSPASVALVWQNAADHFQRFVVERRTTGAGEFDAIANVKAMFYADTTTQAGIRYQYRVAALADGCIAAYSAVTEATGAATAASLEPIRLAEPRLRWSDVSENYSSVDWSDDDSQMSCFAPNGQRLFFRADNGNLLQSIFTGVFLSFVGWSDDNARVGFGALNKLEYFELASGITAQTFRGDVGFVAAGDWLTNAEHLLAAAGEGIYLWSGESSPPEQRFQNNADVEAVRVSRNGQWVAGGDENGNVWVWQTQDWQPVTTLANGSVGVRRLIWTDQDRFLAVGMGDGSTRLFRSQDWQLETTVTAGDLSFDAALIAALVDTAKNQVRLFDARSGQPLTTVSLPDADLQSLRWANGSHTLAVVGSGVWLWDFEILRD